MLFAAILERNESKPDILLAQLSSDARNMVASIGLSELHIAVIGEAAIPLSVEQIGKRSYAAMPSKWATAMGYHPGRLVYLEISHHEGAFKDTSLLQPLAQT